MGENGYELPEPNLSGEGPVFEESDVDREDPKFEAADDKCQSLLGWVQTTNCPPTISCGVAEKAVGSTRFTVSS